MGHANEKLEEKKMKKIKKDKKTTLKKEDEGNEKIKPIGKKKRKREKGHIVDTGKVGQISKEKNIKVEGKKIKNKHKKKRKGEEKNSSLVCESDLLGNEEECGLDEQHDNGAADQSLSKAQEDTNKFKIKSEAINGSETRTRKSKKSRKKKKEPDTTKESEKLLEKKEEAVEDGVYYISSGEEDCSKGMKKWLVEYHQSRPGLKVLQQRIDDFINAHEEKLEQERKEREAEAAKDGWTVVVHHKGRKKTTDSESGVTVGSVAPAVAESLLATKKSKEVNLDFYRFQKREAQRSEILALQNKFEQDRKRIQQLRAARKFRPY